MRCSQWTHQLGFSEWNQLHKSLRKQPRKQLQQPTEGQKEKEKLVLWQNKHSVDLVTKKYPPTHS